MKVVGRIYRWIIISVILQIIILAFINNVYLNRNEEVKTTSVETMGGFEFPDNSIKIPEGVEHIKVSYSGKYVAYVLDNMLHIFDIQAVMDKKTIKHDTDNIAYYKWLPDRNMVIYALNAPDSEQGRVQLMTYDVDQDVERAYPKISKLPSKSEVGEIELSPLTNVVYLKIKTGASQGAIYKYNIMSNLSYVMSTGTDTVIKETSYSDKLVYQDAKNKLYVRDGIKNTVWPFPYKSKMALLGIDSEDKVYVGELDKESKVCKIYYGKLAVEPDKAWTPIVLKTPIPPKTIIITVDGHINRVDEEENAIYNVRNDSKANYEGEFVELIQNCIVSIQERKLKFTPININDEKIKN